MSKNYQEQGEEDYKNEVIEVKENEPNHSGPGLYAYYSEYLDEGSIKL